MRLHQSSLVLESYDKNNNSYKPGATYTAWNKAIADHFFNSSRNSQPVYLQADAETIQTIGQQLGLLPSDAELSFVRAVHRYIFVTNPHANNIILSAKYMPRDGQPPDFIGFLALCVLAASHMERDDDLGVSAANYYRCLNEMLELEREGRPPWFADTVVAWHKLEEWLHVVHQGRYGIATARPLHPSHPYVGYPQSQCLLRAADRQQLPAFFRWARLQPGDMPSREWLAAMVRDWASQSRCPLSPPAKRRILENSDAVADAVVSIIALELQAWDGTDSDIESTGPRAARPLLHITFHSIEQQVSWYQYQGETWTALSAVPDLFTRETPNPGESVVVFGDHPDIGQWTFVPRITLGAMHVLLAHESQALRVRAFLERTARPTWREQQLHGIPPGWHCFRGVELVRADPTAPWNSLRLQDNVTVRLNGGLLLDRDMYMAGFEPTLIIDGPEPVTPILLDQQPLPDHAGGQTVILLSSHCPQPGYHIITVGSRTRRFSTRAPHRPALSAHAMPQIAYPLRRTERHYVPCANGGVIVAIPPITPGTVYLSGALVYGHPEDLPGVLPHTAIVQDGFKGYIVIGRQPGEIVEHRIEFTSWKGMQAARQQLISFDVPFEPQWLIKIGRHKRYLSALHPNVQPPTATPIGDRSQVEAWIRALGRKSYQKRFGQEQSTMWQAYAEAGIKLKATR